MVSISRRSPISNGRLAVSVWSEQTIADSAALLRRMIGPAGNTERERLFRMNVTLCLHRACTPEEVASLPDYFHTDPATDLAGGPVEILYESEEGSLSTRPCHNPGRYPLDPRNPLLWFPLDCRACPPCRARAKLDATYDEKNDGIATGPEEMLGRVPRG